jgi:DNA-binding LytR/AlgR family response regulator
MRHTSAVVIEGDSGSHPTELLAELGFPDLRPLFETDDPAHGAHPGKAVGVTDGWTFVWDPQTFFGLFPLDDQAAPPDDPWDMFESRIWPSPLDEILARMSGQRRVFSFITEGAILSHGFAWYASGSRQRAWLSVDGEIVFQDGTPLREEAVASAEEPDDEQRLFVLGKMLTGVGVVPATPVRFTVYGSERTPLIVPKALQPLRSRIAPGIVLAPPRPEQVVTPPRHREWPSQAADGTFPVAPLRDVVAFPSSVLPLFFGREKSLNALRAAMRTDDRVVLATQRNAVDDDPGADAIYRTGTLASVIQFLELDDGTAEVFLQGISRVKILNYTGRAEYLEAEAAPVNDATDEDLAPLAALVRAKLGVCANLRGLPELVEFLELHAGGDDEQRAEAHDYGRFADQVASHLQVDVHDRQTILETAAVGERLKKLLDLMDKPRREPKLSPSADEIVSAFRGEGPRRQVARHLPIEDGATARAPVDRIVAVHRREHRTDLFDGTATISCPLTLDDVELRLDENHFVRVHRDHIVNTNHIAGVTHHGGDVLLELAGARRCTVPIGRGRLSWLKTRFAVRHMRQMRAAMERL